jgi:hypothetical protein
MLQRGQGVPQGGRQRVRCLAVDDHSIADGQRLGQQGRAPVARPAGPGRGAPPLPQAVRRSGRRRARQTMVASRDRSDAASAGATSQSPARVSAGRWGDADGPQGGRPERCRRRRSSASPSGPVGVLPKIIGTAAARAPAGERGRVDVEQHPLPRRRPGRCAAPPGPRPAAAAARRG